MGIVKAFLERCTFDLRGIPLSLDAAAEADEETRRIVIENVRRPQVRHQVIQSVAKIIGLARSGKETPDVQVETRQAKDLSEFETSPTPYVLDSPYRSVHSRCYFDSSDELKFAKMLEEADDVASWLWNDQSGVGFRIQYSFEGRMPYYYPDFLVKVSSHHIVIVETKGKADLDVPLKMARLRQWCEDINRVQKAVKYDFVYVDEESFEKYKPTSFRQLVASFSEYKP